MPTYEYRCKGCGRELEVVQSFTDASLTVCPHCGGPLRKVFGSIGITFKGDGFYKNDSRSGSKKTSNGASTSSSSDHSHSHEHSHGGHSHSHSESSPSSSSSSSSGSSSTSSSGSSSTSSSSGSSD
jgi:putative FmdB family regulatory protein